MKPITKKERAYIEQKINEYLTYAKEEESNAKAETDKAEKAAYYLQARLNECAAYTLQNLLDKLECHKTAKKSDYYG